MLQIPTTNDYDRFLASFLWGMRERWLCLALSGYHCRGPCWQRPRADMVPLIRSIFSRSVKCKLLAVKPLCFILQVMLSNIAFLMF